MSSPKAIVEHQSVHLDIATVNTSNETKTNEVITTEWVNEKPRLLIVEDNLAMQEYIQFTLKDYYNTIIAGNGQEGINVLNDRLRSRFQR